MSSKSAKKNAKRRDKDREKKLACLVEDRKRYEDENTKIQGTDPVVELKQQLAEAKASGDKKLAAKLRQDLWVLQDASSGQNIELESETVKESLQRLEQRTVTTTQPQSKSVTPVKSKDDTTPSCTLNPIEKEMKKIRKKLEQIEILRKKKDEGAELQACQLEKLDKEELFKQQLVELEESLGSVKVVR